MRVIIIGACLTFFFLSDIAFAVNISSQNKLNILFYQDILRHRMQNSFAFQTNFCMGGRDDFWKLVATETCAMVTARWPGSQISCQSCVGKWVTADHTVIFNHDIIEDQYYTGQLHITSQFGREKNPPFSLFKIENNGNYIVLRYEGDPFGNKIKYRIVDVRLPTSGREAYIFPSKNKELSVELQHNALIHFLNTAYRSYPNINMYEYAAYLLTDSLFRDSVFRQAKK